MRLLAVQEPPIQPPGPFAPYVAPLCPAGHLPRKGGDRLSFLISPVSNAAESCQATKLLISLLAGEMSGRTEGGVKGRGPSIQVLSQKVVQPS